MKCETASAIIIEEAHPLKQGLKLANGLTYDLGNAIEEAHPLKQGLKQRCACS